MLKVLLLLSYEVDENNIWFSKSGTEPFNLALNTILAYGYEYNYDCDFFFGEYKLKINKWCLHLRYLYFMYFLL